MYTDTSNTYVSILYDLVEAVYYKDYGLENRKMEEKNRKRWRESCYSVCKQCVNKLRNLRQSLSFDDMWQFAEFIMTAEYSYFYQNVQGSEICCDMCTNDKRVLFFSYPDKNVYIKIIMERGSVDKLAIQVYREFGKNVKTVLTVSGSESNINSDNDQMLANTINAFVQNSMADLFDGYVELAYNGLIYDAILGDTKYKSGGNSNEVR